MKPEKKFKTEDYLMNYLIASKMFGAEKPEFGSFCTGFYAGLLAAINILRVKLSQEDTFVNGKSIAAALSVIMEDFRDKITEIEEVNRLADMAFGKKMSKAAREAIYQYAVEITEGKKN